MAGIPASRWATRLFCTWVVLALADRVHAELTGAELFEEECEVCHTIGGGRDTGPDLAGVTERRDDAWLKTFIRDPQAMIDAGDPWASAVYVYFEEEDMPDSDLTDAQIDAIIGYLRASGDGAGDDAKAAVTGDAARGRDLFQGIARFAGRGPACNGCHDLRAEGVFGGGSLAKDLTAVAATKTARSLAKLIDGSPFPAMQRAYADGPLSESEVSDVVAFVRAAGAAGAPSDDRSGYAGQVLGGGFAGLAVLYGFFGLAWRARRRRSINQDIFDRQLSAR